MIYNRDTLRGKELIMEEKLNLTNEWDKIFTKSDKVNHEKVTFHNRYGITLAADLYTPKNAQVKLPAIAVCGPFGAVKEQSSGLYAQTIAERGFLTIAFDPSFTGESGGQPRYVASPDINTEDFCAAVDYLSCRDDVDADRIGIIGICGWGGMAINAAAIDTRIKATVASTMYDMTRVTAKGYFDSADSEQARYETKKGAFPYGKPPSVYSKNVCCKLFVECADAHAVPIGFLEHVSYTLTFSLYAACLDAILLNENSLYSFCAALGKFCINLCAAFG